MFISSCTSGFITPHRQVSCTNLRLIAAAGCTWLHINQLFFFPNPEAVAMETNTCVEPEHWPERLDENGGSAAGQTEGYWAVASPGNRRESGCQREVTGACSGPESDTDRRKKRLECLESVEKPFFDLNERLFSMDERALATNFIINRMVLTKWQPTDNRWVAREH